MFVYLFVCLFFVCLQARSLYSLLVGFIPRKGPGWRLPYLPFVAEIHCLQNSCSQLRDSCTIFVNLLTAVSRIVHYTFSIAKSSTLYEYMVIVRESKNRILKWCHFRYRQSINDTTFLLSQSICHLRAATNFLSLILLHNLQFWRCSRRSDEVYILSHKSIVRSSGVLPNNYGRRFHCAIEVFLMHSSLDRGDKLCTDLIMLT